MTVWGEASYKVKRAIPFHERFTVGQLVDSTGLAYGQVEQVVQRLIRKGYVRKLEPHELLEGEKAQARRVGRPRQRYALTDDAGKREEFFASVNAVAAAERLSRARERKPNTVYYAAAMEIVEAMERDGESASQERLEEAASLLTYGREYEELVPEGIETVQPYYDAALARVAALRGDYPAAQSLLRQAKAAFEDAGLDEEARKIDDLETSIRAGLELERIEMLLRQHRDPLPSADALAEFLRSSPASSWFLSPLRKASELVATVLRAKEDEVTHEGLQRSLH